MMFHPWDFNMAILILYIYMIQSDLFRITKENLKDMFLLQSR